MTTLHLVPPEIAATYEVHEWRNAVGVLTTACPEEWADIQLALRMFKLLRSEVLAPGKNRSSIVDRLERPLKDAGWIEKQFATSIVVDGDTRDSPTHSVDCFKGRVALEVEWNNKDPFYDRDLNNFRLLFDLQVIDVGVIITRCSSLQAIFNALDKGPSYGNSTTHMGKLLPRLRGGSGGGCPIVAFGISEAVYIED
ncbi:MAG: restriction endonuclease [Sphingopyxis sp.]|nr:restriction endonuclease [Sphingopyxis sp.]